MLTCKQLNDSATRYLEGDYGLKDKISFWIHLSMCVHCRRYLKQFKLAIATVRLMVCIKEPDEKEIDYIVDQLKSIRA